MKVLHLVAGELSGGAARGAYWLHKGQQIIGIDSYMVTNGRVSNGDDSILELCTSFWGRFKFTLFSRIGNFPLLLYPLRMSWIFHYHSCTLKV